MSLVDEVLAENVYDPSQLRARRGQWAEAVKAVHALVLTGFPVSEAVRRVLKKVGAPEANFSSLRCSYYNHIKMKK